VSCVNALQGTQIQGTFWRESAEKYLDALQEGKVRFDDKFDQTTSLTNMLSGISSSPAGTTCCAAASISTVTSAPTVCFVHAVSICPTDLLLLNNSALCCRCTYAGFVAQVYYFSKFSVKVANKQYATVRNDYELHFDNRCGTRRHVGAAC
jgi:hypothetical protein